MSHRERLTALVDILRDGEHLWRPRPFVTDQVPWRVSAREVVSWCEGLSEAEVAAIEASNTLPSSAPAGLRTWESRISSAIGDGPILSRSVGAVHNQWFTAQGDKYISSVMEVGSVHDWQVPARKLGQIHAFGHVVCNLGFSRAPQSIVDWCGGKGHLGRTLAARLGLPVRVIERESDYRADALNLSRRAGVKLDFVCADAFRLETRHELEGTTLAVGLHACGGLGTRLLEHAVASQVAAVCLSPCCLHKEAALRTGPYPWVSRLGAEVCGDFVLDHSALRLATSDEVVARPSLRAQRRRENSWRLGLDLLLQDAFGHTDYTPLGTLPHEALRHDFAHFVEVAAQLRGLVLPDAWDPSVYEARGLARAQRARALGIVRSLFRRAIEALCAVDRAAYLAEHGYDSQVIIFTSREVTPRNLLIVGLPSSPREPLR